MISQMTFLERLVIDISQSFFIVFNLEKIKNFQRNQICDGGAQNICVGVKDLTFLKTLSLDFSRFWITFFRRITENV